MHRLPIRMIKLSAFTLIELLIVVAIIAILAAIAVPNFVEAQMRSKVTRVKSELRTLRTALETYCIDTSKYPFENGPDTAMYNMGKTVGLRRLTTPVAYVSNIPYDVFTPKYYPKTYEYTYFRPIYAPTYTGFQHAWILVSFGPDLIWDGAEYDPTNGTMSAGNISVRQGNQDSVDVASR